MTAVVEQRERSEIRADLIQGSCHRFVMLQIMFRANR
jgi:hypothetical protein